jgi:hypothetical protein
MTNSLIPARQRLLNGCVRFERSLQIRLHVVSFSGGFSGLRTLFCTPFTVVFCSHCKLLFFSWLLLLRKTRSFMFAKFAKFVKRFLQSISQTLHALLHEKIKSSKNGLKNSPKTALVSRSCSTGNNLHNTSARKFAKFASIVPCHFTEILRHFRTTLCAIAQQKFFCVGKNSEKGRCVSA